MQSCIPVPYILYTVHCTVHSGLFLKVDKLHLRSVSEPALFWAASAPALEVQGPDSGSEQTRSAPYTNIFNFVLLRSEILMQVSLFWITFTVINCFHVLSQQQGFPFCLPKKGGYGSRLRPTKKSAPAPP